MNNQGIGQLSSQMYIPQAHVDVVSISFDERQAWERNEPRLGARLPLRALIDAETRRPFRLRRLVLVVLPASV